MADLTHTDVSRPSALPTANLLPRGPAGHGHNLPGTANSSSITSAAQQAALEQNSEEYLDAIEEEWNKKVDAEVDVLVDGMMDIVSLAAIGDKDKFRIAQDGYEAQCRAESMVRAAHSLLSITHSMKLMLLLSDEAQIANQRDAELKSAAAQSKNLREEAAALATVILRSSDVDEGR